MNFGIYNAGQMTDNTGQMTENGTRDCFAGQCVKMRDIWSLYKTRT